MGVCRDGTVPVDGMVSGACPTYIRESNSSIAPWLVTFCARTAAWVKKQPMTTLNWRVNELATVLHVTAAIARGWPTANQRLAHAVALPAAAIEEELLQAKLPIDATWSALCAVACQQTEIETTVCESLARCGGASLASRQSRIVRLLSDAAGAIRHALPDLQNELGHRGRPLREQWEARGPGFLHNLRRLTGDCLQLERATAFPVIPILGGGGDIDPTQDAVRIEAVLANTVAELPEVVRLGWMLAQLACYHLPDHGPQLQSPTHCDAIALGMVPAALAAAEAVELAACNAETVQKAVFAWQPRPSGAETVAAKRNAGLAWEWWQGRRAENSWETAIAELEQQLATTQ